MIIPQELLMKIKGKQEYTLIQLNGMERKALSLCFFLEIWFLLEKIL